MKDKKRRFTSKPLVKLSNLRDMIIDEAFDLAFAAMDWPQADGKLYFNAKALIDLVKFYRDEIKVRGEEEKRNE